jgi:hypothetical protein
MCTRFHLSFPVTCSTSAARYHVRIGLANQRGRLGCLSQRTLTPKGRSEDSGPKHRGWRYR